MTKRDDLNTPVIALVGLIGTIGVLVVIVLLTVIYYQVEARQDYEKNISRPAVEFAKLTADQQGLLASYGWIDQEKGIARIPISRAMELVVDEIAADPEAASPEPVPEDEEAAEDKREDAGEKASEQVGEEDNAK